MKRIWLWYKLCALPLHHLVITSGYGYRIHPVTGQYRFHSGIDFRASADTAFAVLPGRIDAVGYDASLGVYVRLVQDSFSFTYGHLSQVFVLPGDAVRAAAPLAITGSTGRVTGEHLHFNVRYKDHRVDPLLFLKNLTPGISD